MSEERAVLAGGCFWGMQDLIRRLPGVLSTRVGYSGGDVANATYRNHGTHAEADRDPSSIPRAHQLSAAARILLPDPRPDDANRQGNDRGT
jgi:peptide-methionine (S)-S-oxide reductase